MQSLSGHFALNAYFTFADYLLTFNIGLSVTISRAILKSLLKLCEYFTQFLKRDDYGALDTTTIAGRTKRPFKL